MYYLGTIGYCKAQFSLDSGFYDPPTPRKSSDYAWNEPIYGMAWFGMVWYGLAWFGLVWNGMRLMIYD